MITRYHLLSLDRWDVRSQLGVGTVLPTQELDHDVGLAIRGAGCLRAESALHGVEYHGRR